MHGPRSDAELTTFAARAALTAHSHCDSVGASTLESFEAAVHAWLAYRPFDTHGEAQEAVLALLIALRGFARALKH